MTSDPDDALSWEGDDTPAASPRSKEVPLSEEAPSLPEGWNAVGKGSETVRSTAEPALPSSETVKEASDPDAATERGLSTAALLSFGVLGGIFLLYAVGWVIGGLRLQPLARFLVADAMYLPWMWLAVLAPALWVVAVLVLTRGRATWIRILALVGGVVLLVPWPFVMIGAFGS